MDYKDSGVSFERANALNKIFKSLFNINTNGFAGQIPINNTFKEPILLASTDGVGTKISLAKTEDDFYKIGVDLFAGNANDLLTYGVKPLFFLDYISTNSFNIESIKAILSGLNAECIKYDCKVLGGESAELSGFYLGEHIDIAGFCVAIGDKQDLIDSNKIEEGDIVLGLESSGFHANGYSLLRKILFEKNNLSLDDFWPDLEKRRTVREVLLEPTKVYISSILKLKKEINIKGLANITGSGILANIKRILPKNLELKLSVKTALRDLFLKIAELGDVTKQEMSNVFNLGIGYVVIINKKDLNNALSILEEQGESVYVLGSVIKADKSILTWD